MDGVSTFVMAGGIGARLLPLTRDRCKPAVSFGDRYRLIDFTLSNCLYSGVKRVSVLVQYRSASLTKHIAQLWGAKSRESSMSVETLPSGTADDRNHYRGTADSIHQNRWVFDRERPRDVLVLAGDHVYCMDYRPFLDWHRRTGAALTIATVSRPRRECRELGIIQRRNDGRVEGFLEKPSPDDHRLGYAEDLFASMGIYIFRADVLSEVLREGPGENRWFDFGVDIIPRLMEVAPVQSYLFSQSPGGREAYWRDVGTIDSYFAANMDLLAYMPPIDTSHPLWQVVTPYSARFPAWTVYGTSATIDASLVGAHCRVEGSVVHSVVCPGAVIEEGAEVEDSVILPGARIGAHSIVRQTIVDEDATLAPGMVVGYGDDRDGVHRSRGGVAVLGASSGSEEALKPRRPRQYVSARGTYAGSQMLWS